MTQNEFVSLCEKYGVAPSVALENESVREALKARDSAAVERALKEEF